MNYTNTHIMALRAELVEKMAEVLGGKEDKNLAQLVEEIQMFNQELAAACAALHCPELIKEAFND